MLGKLMKYELGAAGRLLIPFWLGLLAMGIFTNIMMRLSNATNAVWINALTAMFIFLFFICCMVVGVMAIVAIVMRFRQSMLSQEGYLTHTLPVSVHQLVWSRMLVATLYLLATTLVIFVSILAAVFKVELVSDMLDMFQMLFQEIWEAFQMHGVAFILEFLALIVASGLTTCLVFYTALSIGHSFANHKMLLSVVFYFVIQTVVQIISTVELVFISYSASTPQIFSDLSPTQSVHTLLLTLIIHCVIYGAIFYLLTTQMLKRRLNLA